LVEVILPNLGGGRAAGFLVVVAVVVEVGVDFSLLLAFRVDSVGTALWDLVDR
jgi:hypothetical protein